MVEEKVRAVISEANSPPFVITPKSQTLKRWLKLLIYGTYGVGKSTLAGSAVDVEQMRDVLYIDAEGGDLALQDNPRVCQPDEIEHVRVTNFMQVARVQEFLKAHCSRRDRGDLEGMRNVEAMLKGCSPSDIKKPREFRTVLTDSVTEIEQYCMYGLLKVDPGSIVTGAADEIDVARFDEYKKQNMMLLTLIKAFRDLPIHVISVCSQAYTQDELKRFHYGPQMTGKLSSQIQGAFDVVGFLKAGTPEADGVSPRRLYVQPIDRFDAKCRLAGFKEPYIEDPTMSSLMKAFKLLK